jgi:hypothetical protein
MQGEHVGVEYEVVAHQGVVFEEEYHHNPTRELLFCVTSGEEKIHRLNNLFCVVEGLLGTLYNG